MLFLLPLLVLLSVIFSSLFRGHSTPPSFFPGASSGIAFNPIRGVLDIPCLHNKIEWICQQICITRFLTRPRNGKDEYSMRARKTGQENAFRHRRQPQASRRSITVQESTSAVTTKSFRSKSLSTNETEEKKSLQSSHSVL